jgi:gliding motility-associated-like protein
MRHCLFIVFYACITAVHCICQNLVPNNSFEIHTGCPTTQGDIIRATPWERVNGQTSDYFHPCGLTGWYSAPDNSTNFGFQVAADGSAYAGIRAWDDEWGPLIREYIGVSLLTPLTACQNYFVSFKVSLANGPKTKWATDALGLYFSNTIISTSTAVLNNFSPQIKNPAGNIITDTSGWTTISGNYLAHGGETYIIIGNFKDYDSTTVIALPYANLSVGSAYYYIDDVEVIPDQAAYLNLGSDTTICSGQSIVLSSNQFFSNYQWQDSSSYSFLPVTSGGLYWLNGTLGNCMLSDSVIVTEQVPPALFLGNDTALCEGENLIIGSTFPGYYSWDNGSTASTISVSHSGEYTLTIDTAVCIVTDEINVTFDNCIYVPNAFSPNGDDQNDIFYVRGYKSGYFHFIIYDRWGAIVFETENPLNGWDGKIKGTPAEAAVYFYYVELDSSESNSRYIKKGNVSLVK